jgi:CIC family chloride channel protein
MDNATDPTAERLAQRLPHLVRRMLHCLLVGIVAGLGATLFYILLTATTAALLGHACHFVPPETRGEPSPFAAWLTAVPHSPIRWLLVLMPALGGLVSGLLVFTCAPEAEGHGTDSAILAYHYKGGRIRGRVPIVKTIASALTIGSGGSGGREGPIAQIGAGFGSVLADLLHLPDRERRILMAAGLGAGVGAIFKAPLAGAIFASEVLYQGEEMEHEALLPATVASVVAYAIYTSVFGTQPIFEMASLTCGAPTELLGYAILGGVCAAAAVLYVKVFYGTRDLFAAVPLPKALKPALGGLLTGLVGLAVPAGLATSYGQIQIALDGQLALGFLLALGFAKILTTSLSIGSGGSGGVFGPAMVIGGCFGGATGIVLHHLGLVHDPAAMVLVGMTGFFAGAANTPLSTIIMVSEMTGNWGLLVPCMVTCSIAAVLARRHSIYENQVRGRAVSPVHEGETFADAAAEE